MAVHGFRLYTVEVTTRLGRGRLDFHKAPLVDPAKAFAARVGGLKGQVFVREASYRADDPGEADVSNAPSRTPVMRIDGVKQAGTTVEVQVSYGRKGDYGFAIDLDGGADIPLQRAAAGRPYRVLVHFPRAGHRAVMVAEVVSRTHVGEVLMKRISVENHKQAQQPDGTETDWLRWLPSGMFDESRIREVLENGAVEGIRLRRRGASGAGRKGTQDLTLTQLGLPSGKRREAEKLIKKWVKKYLGKADSPGAEPVAALTALVDADVSGVQFTDGEFRFNESGKEQGLGPSTLDRILMYPMQGETLPDTATLRKESNRRLRPLAELESIPVDLAD